MIVMVLQRVPKGLKGQLTRWLLEPRPGVFVGDVSALVRDKLWDAVESNAGGGDGILIHASNTEQGFDAQTFGLPDREIVDLDGLKLFKVKTKST